MEQDEGEVENDHQGGGLIGLALSREEEKAEMERRHSERLNEALHRQERRRDALTREERERLDQVDVAAEQMEVELKVELKGELSPPQLHSLCQLSLLVSTSESKLLLVLSFSIRSPNICF